MLQKLNEKIQGVIAWVVIILIVITFAIFGVDYYIQSRHESNAEVEVNDQPITKQAFEANYRRTRQMREPSLLTADLENKLRQQVLDEMIINKVSVQAANANGFNVNVDQANAAILKIQQFQQDGHFSSNRYQQVLNGAFFTPESFQNEVRQGMLLNQQRFAFIGTSFALPSEIKQFVELSMQTRTYDFIKIPALQFVHQINVTPEEIASYYKKHQKAFLSPEKVSIHYLRLSMSDIKNEIKVSPQQIQHYYEENKTNYYLPAKWKVAHILFAVPADASTEDEQKIKLHSEETYHLLQKTPSEFDQVLKQVSDDKVSISNNGVLPWIIAGQSEFDKALVNLTKPGEFSAPIKSEHGYEIFKLVAYDPASVKPFADVKNEIKEQLVTELAQAKYAQVLEKLSDLAYQTPDSLDPVADALHLQIQHTEPFSRNGVGDDLAKNKQVVNVAFSHEVLALGNNSEPIQLDNDSVVVLRIKQHLAAAEESRADVSAKITEILTMNKAKLKAIDLGKSLLSLNNEVPQQDKLMSENNLKWETVSGASRDTEATHEKANELAFSFAQIGTEEGRSLASGDYIIVRLKEIKDGDFNSLEKDQIASITQQIEANYGMMDYELYVNNLREHAKIGK